MGLSSTDLGLIIALGITVLADVVLALCLRFILPKHITHPGEYYPADGRKLKFDDAVKICPCFAQVFPHGTSELITLAPVDGKLEVKNEDKMPRTKRDIKGKYPLTDKFIKALEGFPFAVQLSFPKTVNGQKRLACNGLIKTDKWLLTGRNCVQANAEWYTLDVRSGPSRWSRFGRRHYVVGYANVSSLLVALKVVPEFKRILIPSTQNFPFGYDIYYIL